MVSRCWATIDTGAIEHNVRAVQKLMQDTKIMGIVKADAYGHGAVECARTLAKAGVDFFAVAALDEAIELRKAGIDQDILILGYTTPRRFEELAQYDLIQAVVSDEYAREIANYPLPIRTHLKLDTGMNRSGIHFDGSQKDKEELLTLYTLPGLRIDGIFSHFAVADELDEESEAFTALQKERFDQALAFLKEQKIDPGITHLQNSYGVLNYGPQGYDYCRPGLLYMGVTSDDSIPVRYPLDLRPALSLEAEIALVKEIEAGDSVSYGRNYSAQEPRTIATVTIGYADGLPRACSNKGLEVLVQGKRVPVIGNICMDQCMIDVSGLEGVKAGQSVTLIGEQDGERICVDEISRLAGTINNETLSRLGARIQRVYPEKDT